MPSVTRYYKISGAVEFLNVDVARDNRFFVDPRAVRLEAVPKPFAAQAQKCLDDFFEEIATYVISRKRADRERGLDLLQHFNEPRETRLGMSKESINGHGGDDDVGKWIWNEMSTNLRMLLKVGILKMVEDIPVFVEGIDRDITSDLTTRIIFEPLAKFTEAMVAKYPEFSRAPHQLTTVKRPVWDTRLHKWSKKEFELPVAEGTPLVLIPKYWARPWLLMFGGRYYETTMLSFVRDERAVIDPQTGKLSKEAKRDLKKKNEFERGRKTIIRITQQAKEQRQDLMAEFRNYVDGKYERLDDEEIDRRLKRKR